MSSEPVGVERRVEVTVQGPAGSSTVRLSSGSTFVGRGEQCGLRLEDAAVEQRHLELAWDGEQLWAIHLGGATPTLNGSAIHEARLRSGDRLELGEHTLVVRIFRRARPGGTEAPSAEQVAAGEAAARAAAAAAPGAAAAVPSEQVLLEYTAHQLVQQPRRAMLVGAILVAFLLLMQFYLAPGNWTMMAVGTAIILGSISAFVFPVRYRLTEEGVEIRGVMIRDFKKWTRFDRYQVFADAVQLYVPQKSIRGRLQKGTLVYFRANRDEVMNIIKSKIKKPVS